MKTAYKTTILYFLFASLWILLTDKIVQYISPNLAFAAFFSSFKGIIFVITTSLLLFLFVSSDLRKLNTSIDSLKKETDEKRQLINELHHRIGSTIQLILSFFDDTEKLTNDDLKSIKSKLISMESVFNIVYSNDNINSPKVKSVLDEYVHSCKKNIKIKYAYVNNTLPVEALVTLLLTVDSITDCLIANNGVNEIQIEVRNNENITISFKLIERPLTEIISQCDQFIVKCLNQIHASIELQNDYVSHIIILFPAQNRAQRS